MKSFFLYDIFILFISIFVSNIFFDSTNFFSAIILFFLSGTFTLTFFYLIAKIGGINFKKYAVWAILFWIIVVPMLIYLVLYYCLT